MVKRPFMQLSVAGKKRSVEVTPAEERREKCHEAKNNPNFSLESLSTLSPREWRMFPEHRLEYIPHSFSNIGHLLTNNNNHLQSPERDHSIRHSKPPDTTIRRRPSILNNLNLQLRLKRNHIRWSNVYRKLHRKYQRHILRTSNSARSTLSSHLQMGN